MPFTATKPLIHVGVCEQLTEDDLFEFEVASGEVFYLAGYNERYLWLKEEFAPAEVRERLAAARKTVAAQLANDGWKPERTEELLKRVYALISPGIVVCETIFIGVELSFRLEFDYYGSGATTKFGEWKPDNAAIVGVKATTRQEVLAKLAAAKG